MRTATAKRRGVGRYTATSLALVWLLLGTPWPSSADSILFDNGAPFPSAGSLSDIGRTHPVTIADQIALTEPFTANAVRFWGLYFPSDSEFVTDHFSIAFYANSRAQLPGALLASHPLDALSRIDTGIDASQGFRMYQFEGTFHPFKFRRSGTYWVSIYNNTPGHSDDWVWNWTFPTREGRLAYQVDGEAWGELAPGHGQANLAFQLLRVPEPTTIALLITGLGGVAVSRVSDKLRRSRD